MLLDSDLSDFQILVCILYVLILYILSDNIPLVR